MKNNFYCHGISFQREHLMSYYDSLTSMLSTLQKKGVAGAQELLKNGEIIPIYKVFVGCVEYSYEEMLLAICTGRLSVEDAIDCIETVCRKLEEVIK